MTTDRIVFLNPTQRHMISGGLKTVYRHAEMLTELGFDAHVYQPEGRADWLKSTAKVLTAYERPAAGDVLVFPENATGWLGEWAQSRLPSRKVLFCQNQYYLVDGTIPPERYQTMDFAGIACPSEIARGFLSRVFHLTNVAVIPNHIDRNLFSPGQKQMRIALMPHKLPRQALLIQTAFHAKYPRLKTIPWEAIVQTTEEQTADILARATIYLSLSSLESFGLVPLEAMSAGCIVVGFHGYGGMEYASPKNGYWVPHDHIEEAADALATVVSGLERNDPGLVAMRSAGFETVDRYPKTKTIDALASFYGRIAGRIS